MPVEKYSHVHLHDIDESRLYFSLDRFIHFTRITLVTSQYFRGGKSTILEKQDDKKSIKIIGIFFFCICYEVHHSHLLFISRSKSFSLSSRACELASLVIFLS